MSEPRWVEPVRLREVPRVVVDLVEAGGDEVLLGQRESGEGGLVHGHVVHCQAKYRT